MSRKRISSILGNRLPTLIWASFKPLEFRTIFEKEPYADIHILQGLKLACPHLGATFSSQLSQLPPSFLPLSLT